MPELTVDRLDTLMTRIIMFHRGITIDQLTTSKNAQRRPMAWLKTPSNVEKADHIITRISDLRGGIPAACCGAEADEDMRRLLEEGV
jgi:hypothetical protein